MPSFLKIAVPTVAIGSAGGTYLIYDYVSNKGESLRDRLVRELTGKPYKVLSSTDVEWVEVKKIYKKSKAQISNIDENNLSSWCSDKLKLFKYSDEVYVNSKKGCLIKTSSILQELGDKAISVADSPDNVETEGRPAGNRYNNRDKSKNDVFQINNAEFKEATDEASGKTAMKKGCGDVYKKSMYQEDAESLLTLALKWCVKPIP